MVKLDELDIKILSFLQEDSRMTIRDIAKELNISTTPIFNRIKRLEKEKVIDRYVAIVNADQVGKMLFAFVFLNLKDHSKKAIQKMEAQVTSFPEVLECHYVTGGADFFLKVIVKDIKEYNSFVSEKLFSVPNIGKIESLLSLSMAKSTNVIPLDNESF